MKFKEILVWLLIFIIGSLIVSFILSPNSFDIFKSKIDSINSNIKINSSKQTEDLLTSQCLSKFKECKDILEKKFTYIEIKMNEYKRVETDIEFNSFTEIWGEPLPPSFGEKIEKDFPCVLISYTMEIDDFSSPSTALCIDGKLVTKNYISGKC